MSRISQMWELLRSTHSLNRGGRLYGEAVSYGDAGKHAEALSCALRAFEWVRGDRFKEDNPAAFSLMLACAKLIDESAAKTGDRVVARQVLSEALDVIERVIATNRALSEWDDLPRYIQHFRNRLSALQGDA